jgi:hypothetical protein
MGTIFEQDPRNYKYTDGIDQIVNQTEYIDEVCHRTGWEKSEVIELCKMLEIRRKNNLYVANGDIFDEQMKGLAELFQEFISILSAGGGDYPQPLEAIAIALGYEQPGS